MVTCPKCFALLSAGSLNSPGLIPCPVCGTAIYMEVFPALLRKEETVRSGQNLLLDDEASCFYHPSKKATVPCSSCGRFLCSLCDVAFDDQHLCPSCLEAGKRKQKITNLNNYRVLYDNIALALAIFPMFLWPFTFVTASLAIFAAIRYWKTPSSLVPRTKIRFIIAFLIAGIQITAWAGLIVAWIA